MHQLTDSSIRALQAGTVESNSANIRSALARGLSEFQPALCAHDGTMVIVGSGPSVTSFLEHIKEERRNGRPICAIKGAHDWLMANGVEPDLFVSCEPRDRPLKIVSDKCRYLIASRCSPALLDQLTGKQVTLWHSFASKTNVKPTPEKPVMTWDDFDPEEECEVWRGRIGVGGGSTSGLRAIYIAYMLGFRRVSLYGFDSCLAKDRLTKRFTGEDVGTGMVVDVIVGGKRFWCNGALAKQASEFQEVLNYLHGLKVVAHGDGLIAEILEQRRRRSA